MTTRSRLLELTGAFDGWRYSRDDVGYPWPLGREVGIDVVTATSVDVPKATNCCCFVEAVLVRLFGLDATWTRARHRRAMALGEDRYGPVEVWVDAGIANLIEPSSARGLGVDVVQGWRRDGGGHTMIVIDGAHVLEANTGQLRGVGWRGVGRAGPRPEVPRASGGWGWSRLRQVYPDLRAARLRLTG